jgi:hypothetical protein
MTHADESYAKWWLDRNGAPSTDHSCGKVFYTAGYHDCERELKAKFTAMIESAYVRDSSLQKLADAVAEL